MSINTNNKNDCSGCESCVHYCPQKAIIMKKDENGFLYPFIDKEKCVNCGMCDKVCAYKNKSELNKVLETYAVINKNSKVLEKSSSGGAFYALAKRIIDDEGSVYGSSLFRENKKLVIKHIRVSHDELYRIQGSKYVKSSIAETFDAISKDLNDGKKVLFSGTPCQIDSMKRYLKINRIPTSNIYFVDIICHGVPSLDFFRSYISFIEKKRNLKIENFIFRDKTNGWDLKGKAIGYKNRKKVSIDIYNNTSSYYHYFLTGMIYRQNCYTCKYAQKDRAGDITLGDFWGIEKEYPELLIENEGIFDIKKGISCVLVNTTKGKELLTSVRDKLNIEKVDYEKIYKHNKQLTEPSSCDMEKRANIFKIYNEKGYLGVDKYFIKNSFFAYYIKSLVHKIPLKYRRSLRQLLKK